MTKNNIFYYLLVLDSFLILTFRVNFLLNVSLPIFDIISINQGGGTLSMLFIKRNFSLKFLIAKILDRYSESIREK